MHGVGHGNQIVFELTLPTSQQCPGRSERLPPLWKNHSGNPRPPCSNNGQPEERSSSMPPDFQREGKTPLPGRRRARTIPIHAIEREEAPRSRRRLFPGTRGSKRQGRFFFFSP